MASRGGGDDGGWIEPRRKTGPPGVPRGTSTDLVDALNESLQIAESATHDAEGVPPPAAAKPRPRRAPAPWFPPDPRETLIRRVVAGVALAAAAVAVGWLVARLFGG